MPHSARPDRLDSWKAIAAHLGRSVRTARRWEAEEGLPVHRHMHKAQGSVYAYRAELDVWLRRHETAANAQPAEPTAGPTRAPISDTGASLAVLPFVHLGPDEAQAYLADGFTEELITSLSRIRALRVISRTSSMALKGTARDVGSLGRELAVEYLLEGSVRTAPDRFRVSVRLVDPVADATVWSEQYDGTLEDVFSIQDRIVGRITEALHVRLGAGEHRRVLAHAVSDVVAWRYALEARDAALGWSADRIDRAVALLERALADTRSEDPRERATLTAWLGRTHLQYREAGIDATGAPVERAAALAEEALRLDPESVAALQLQGWLAYSRGDVAAAVRALEAARAIDWQDPDTLGPLANCYLIGGRVAQARDLGERLLVVDPLTPLNRCLPGWADVLEGRFESALPAYREMFELDPDNPVGRLFYVWILCLNGRSGEAAALLPAFEPQASPVARIARLLVGTDGRGGEGPSTEGFDDPGLLANEMFPRLLAEACALAGDGAGAARWMRVSVQRGFTNLPYLRDHHPQLRRLRGNPEWDQLLQEVEERWRAFTQ